MARIDEINSRGHKFQYSFQHGDHCLKCGVKLNDLLFAKPYEWGGEKLTACRETQILNVHAARLSEVAELREEIFQHSLEWL